MWKSHLFPIKNKLNDSFTMEVHGVYPLNFDISATLLIGVIKAGRIKKNDDVLLDKEKGISGKVTFISMFGKILEEAEVGDVCAISVLGDYLSCLPEEVFLIGTETENKEVSTSTNEVSENEKEYIEAYQECLTNDNEISDRERRVLNRLRDSLGIPEERAMELEAQCNPSILSNEEKEYLEEFKACLEDGVISDRERRLLDRLAKSLNISPKRIVQIEKTI